MIRLCGKQKQNIWNGSSQANLIITRFHTILRYFVSVTDKTNTNQKNDTETRWITVSLFPARYNALLH